MLILGQKPYFLGPTIFKIHNQTDISTHIPCIFFPDRSQFSNIWKSFEAMVFHSRVSHGYFSILPWTLAFKSWKKRKISSKHRGIASPCSMCFFWWCSYVQLMLAKHNSLIPRQSITKIWLPLLQLWYKVNIRYYSRFFVWKL